MYYYPEITEASCRPTRPR